MNPNTISWQPISTAPHNKFLLVACRSGYVTTPWCYFVAQFTAGYLDRWDSVSNDGLDGEPEYWSELPVPPIIDEGPVWKVPVNASSQVKAFRYDPAKQELFVRFSSGVYVYSDVPLGTYQLLQQAESAGSFLNREIKGSFLYKKIEE